MANHCGSQSWGTSDHSLKSAADIPHSGSNGDMRRWDWASIRERLALDVWLGIASVVFVLLILLPWIERNSH
jgi:hypothetical protein